MLSKAVRGEPMSKTEKTGQVPKPNGPYLAATPEADGNKIVTVAAEPKVSDRGHAKPSMGPARKKDDGHGHEYPGREYETQTVRAAIAKPADRSIIDKQLGSNLDTK